MDIKNIKDYLLRSFGIDFVANESTIPAQKGLTLCLENQLYRPKDLRVVVGFHSSEWFQLYKDINRPNVKLTFASSHATSCAAEEENDEKKIKGFMELCGASRLYWPFSLV